MTKPSEPTNLAPQMLFVCVVGAFEMDTLHNFQILNTLLQPPSLTIELSVLQNTFQNGSTRTETSCPLTKTTALTATLPLTTILRAESF